MADDLQKKAADMVKRVLTVGVGAVFLGDEALKKLVADFKLPKELIGGILESARGTQTEFIRNFSKEIVKGLKDRVDPQEVVQRILENNDIDLQVKVSFRPRKSSATDSSSDSTQDSTKDSGQDSGGSSGDTSGGEAKPNEDKKFGKKRGGKLKIEVSSGASSSKKEVRRSASVRSALRGRRSSSSNVQI